MSRLWVPVASAQVKALRVNAGISKPVVSNISLKVVHRTLFIGQIKILDRVL